MYLNSTLQRRCKQVQPRTAEIQSDEDWVTKIIPFSLSFLFLKLKLFNLGVKKLGDHEVFPDDILIRQRGFKWHAGENTYVGKDHTIHSKIEVIICLMSSLLDFALLDVDLSRLSNILCLFHENIYYYLHFSGKSEILEEIYQLKQKSYNN